MGKFLVMKDVDGHDIYYGDIVSFLSEDEFSLEKAEVFYDEKSACFSVYCMVNGKFKRPEMGEFVVEMDRCVKKAKPLMKCKELRLVK